MDHPTHNANYSRTVILKLLSIKYHSYFYFPSTRRRGDGKNNILQTSAASELNLVFFHEKIKFKPSNYRVIFFLLSRQEYFCTNNSLREGNDARMRCEDMENTPLESRMYFRMNFTSGLFSEQFWNTRPLHLHVSERLKKRGITQ